VPRPKFQLLDKDVKDALAKLDELLPKLTDKQKEAINEAT
jgi:hypothetical protein